MIRNLMIRFGAAIVIGCLMNPTLFGDYLTVTIDGDTSEWASVPVFATDAVDNAGSIDFTSIQIANDENFIYVRYVVNESISSTDFAGVYKSVDEDVNVATGFDIFTLGVIGAEASWQGDFPFENATGVFNTGNGLTSAVNLMSSLQASAGILDVEFAIDRSTIHTVGGANVFPADGDQIALALWTDQGAGDLIGGGAYTLAAEGQAAEINVLVPAYANPCCDGGPNFWSSLTASASDPNRNYDLHAIFNPESGPGTVREPNYLDNFGAGPLADFRTAGGITHGYVATTFGARPIADVKSDIDAYLTGHYAGFVDGIFLDEMSSEMGTAGYYRELTDYVKANRIGAIVFGNPGIPFVNNTSGQTEFTLADYAASVDTIISFENTGAQYADNYTVPPYLDDKTAAGFGVILHGQAVWDASLLQTVANRKAGFLYVTDDLFDPNPFDYLPTYWNQFSSDVSAFNASLVPTVGDFDGDGDVDCDDLDGYAGNIGATVTAELAPLDLDSDGTISATDANTHITTLVRTSNGRVGTFPGDLNCDGQVNVLGDAFALIGNLGNSATSYSQGDINFDGTVNVLGDAFVLIGNLGFTNDPG